MPREDGGARPRTVKEGAAGTSPRADRMADRIGRAALRAGVPTHAVAVLEEGFRAAIAPRQAGPHALGSDQHPDFLHPGRSVLILLQDLRETDPGVLIVGALAESRNPRLRVVPGRAHRILSRLSEDGDRAVGRPSVVEEGEIVEEAELIEDGAFVGEGDVEKGGSPRAYTWWRALPEVEWGGGFSESGPTSERHGGRLGAGGAGRRHAEGEGALDVEVLERIVTAPVSVQRVILADALDVIRHAHLRPDRRERRRAVQLVERVFLPVAPRVHEVFARRFDWWLRRVGGALRDR